MFANLTPEDVARRLVACWNHCEGKSLEELEAPAPQYRLLKQGEFMQSGDEQVGSDATWVPLDSRRVLSVWNPSYGPIRRRVSPAGAAADAGNGAV